jgi:hypothetical protein
VVMSEGNGRADGKSASRQTLLSDGVGSMNVLSLHL